MCKNTYVARRASLYFIYDKLHRGLNCGGGGKSTRDENFHEKSLRFHLGKSFGFSGLIPTVAFVFNPLGAGNWFREP